VAKHDAEAFVFPERHDPVPELTDEVDRLWNEGRHRSALDTTLGFLRANGKSAVAFEWALPLLHTTRTPDPSITEPVTHQQLCNPYFAPIATECARCMNFWYSNHLLGTDYFERMTVFNPIGQQCPVCRYTLCRKCFTPQDAHCPEPRCSGELGVPVLPTGRPRGMPANQHTEKLEHVLILWRDTPTTREEADELLDLTCTWQDCGGIIFRSQVSQAGKQASYMEEQQLGLVLVGLYERHGMITEGGLLNRTRVVPIESPGRGRRLVFVTAAPETGPASQLSGPIRYFLSDEPDTDDPDTQLPKRRWFRRKT
jgi:hypothetical protein